ncbi:RidA family protein [Zavarzinia sp. CC-PAN008]|uniref:RidA family protein n=1 Tax=Zavarzinia sp. CC-PAN008 TaxID=3243332 RepID=UPI003F742DA8
MTVTRFETNARMSQAVVHGDTIYLAGQVGDPAHDFAGQMQDVLGSIDRLLAQHGSDKTKILAATIYITDLANLGAMNAAWEAWMPKGCGPARATVKADLVAPEYIIEIAVIAAK